MGNRRQFRNIGYTQNEIGRGLHINQFGVGAQGGLHLCVVTGIDQADFNPKARQMLPQQFHQTGITHLAGNQMIPGIEQSKEQLSPGDFPG